MKTVGDKLMECVAYMDEHGWCQGILKDGDGRVCAVGALVEIRVRGGISALESVLPQPYRDGDRSQLVRYNNAPDRTYEEIRALFQAAAVIAGYDMENELLTLTKQELVSP